MTDQSIYAQAITMTDPHARAACLQRACAGNPTLRKELDKLLAAHTESGSFLNKPALPITRLYGETDLSRSGREIAIVSGSGISHAV